MLEIWTCWKIKKLHHQAQDAILKIISLKTKTKFVIQARFNYFKSIISHFWFQAVLISFIFKRVRKISILYLPFLGILGPRNEIEYLVLFREYIFTLKLLSEKFCWIPMIWLVDQIIKYNWRLIVSEFVYEVKVACVVKIKLFFYGLILL